MTAERKKSLILTDISGHSTNTTVRGANHTVVVPIRAIGTQSKTLGAFLARPIGKKRF